MPASARVILGVGAGIAAYKVCGLLRLLTESGHRVRVVPTADALRFVGEATWAALSGEPVTTDVWTGVSEVPHVRLGQSADLVLVAPATADLLARAAAGMAGDLLTATLLTARCPVLYAPAMHAEMWEHPATQANVALLRRRGAVVLDPAVGRLTGADSGAGRLPEPEEIFAVAVRLLDRLGPEEPGPGRPPRGRLRGRHQGGDRPGAVHRQLVHRYPGLRAGQDRRRPGRRGDRDRGQRRAARPGRGQGDPGRLGAADAGRGPEGGGKRGRRGDGRRGGRLPARRPAATARSRRTGSRPRRCGWSRTRTSWPDWPRSGVPAARSRSWSDSPPRRTPPSRRPGPSSPARGVTCWWSTRWGTGSASGPRTTRRSSTAPTGRSPGSRAGPRKRSPMWCGTWPLST